MTDKSIFETLVESGVPLTLAAHAEEAAQRPPPLHAQLTRTIAYLFCVGVLALVEFAIIVGLVIALLL